MSFQTLVFNRQAGGPPLSRPLLPDGPPLTRPLLARQGGIVHRLVTLIALAAVVVLLAGAGDDVTTRFDKLGHKLMCRCGCNQVLLECNHVGCTYSDTMRNELMAALQRGDSDNLVLQAFVQKYGPTVMAAPTATGFNRVAWIMPFVALTGGLLLVVWVVKGWNTRRAAVAATAPKLDAVTLDALRRRVHEETEL